MTKFLDRAKRLRTDLSDWVVHYTKATDHSAADNLESILSSGLKNAKDGICFTESPITEFSKLFQIFENYRHPMLSPYGVAVRKNWLFEKGGRPVIYLAKGEDEFLKGPVAHLYEEYDPERRDFSWFREWRLNIPVLPLSPADTLVILPSENEAEGLAYDIEEDGEYEGPGEYSSFAYINRYWHYITLEEIKRVSIDSRSDDIIAKVLSKNKLDEE